MSHQGPITNDTSSNRLFIETDNASYTLDAEEIKKDPIIYFTSTTTRAVTLTFPATFDPGHTVEAYQGFSQGLGDIVVNAPFLSPDLDNFRKPDSQHLVTMPSSKVKIVQVENTLMAYATVSPSLFYNTAAAEVTSYRERYRIRIYNLGTSKIQLGLDDIDIEGGWVGKSRYMLTIPAAQYIPKAADLYLNQRVTWGSGGGQAPEGGQITFDWTRLSNGAKTVDITDNVNGDITFNLYKKPLLTMV